MKALLYKKPVVSAVIINTAALALALYSIFYEQIWVIAFLPLAGILNRRLIDNGKNINKLKKNIILISFILMVAGFLVYSIYMFKIRDAAI